MRCVDGVTQKFNIEEINNGDTLQFEDAANFLMMLDAIYRKQLK